MEMNNEDLGRRIRECRKRKKMTQEELAEKTNISASFLGHIERGTRIPSLETIVSIANTLHMGTDQLLRDSLLIKVPVERNPLFSNHDLHLLRAFLQNQQDALDHWLDIDEASYIDEEDDDEISV